MTTRGGLGFWAAQEPKPGPSQPNPAPFQPNPAPEPTTPDSPNPPPEPLPTYEDPPPVNPVAQRTVRPSLRGRATCGSLRVERTRNVA